MRTTIIPAQITTVEDKIVGNLTLKQILILIVPVFSAAAIYMLLPQTMNMSLYKILIITIISACCILLSLRVKKRIILDWLLLISRYLARPHIYVFNKNDVYYRTVDKEKSISHLSKVHMFNFDFSKRFKIQKRIQKYNAKNKYVGQDYIDINALSIRFNKAKGGLNVAFEQIGK